MGKRLYKLKVAIPNHKERRDLIVDRDIYLKFRNEKLFLYNTTGSTETGQVKIYREFKAPAENINRYIIDYDPFHHDIIHLNGNCFDKRRENLQLADRYAARRIRDTRNIYNNKYKGGHTA